MVNALVITNNFHFIKQLFVEFNKYNLNIKVVGIVTTKTETLEALKTLNFDIIFLDKSLESDYKDNLLEKHKDIIINLSYSASSNIITNNILKYLTSFIAENDTDIRKEKVKKELEYIGYKFKYKGTHYLVDTILQMYSKQNTMVDNLQSGIYPIIARRYNKTVYNIKSSINKATECMYCECDADKLAKYFSFFEDSKPTVKQVIFTIINKIQ